MPVGQCHALVFLAEQIFKSEQVPAVPSEKLSHRVVPADVAMQVNHLFEFGTVIGLRRLHDVCVSSLLGGGQVCVLVSDPTAVDYVRSVTEALLATAVHQPVPRRVHVFNTRVVSQAAHWW